MAEMNQWIKSVSNQTLREELSSAPVHEPVANARAGWL